MNHRDTGRPLLRLLAGGLAGAALLPALCALLAQAGVGQRPGPGLLPAALLLSAAIGGAAGLATLPFAGTGAALALQSGAHFVITGGLALALGGVCRWYHSPAGGACLLGLYTGGYLLIWLSRYALWRLELGRLRRRLGLTGPKSKRRRERG